MTQWIVDTDCGARVLVTASSELEAFNKVIKNGYLPVCGVKFKDQ